jgi:hypothetical protein
MKVAIYFAFALIAHSQTSNAALIRVTDLPNGQQANSTDITGVGFSESGRYIAFGSFASNLVNADNNNQPDIFRKDLQSGQIRCVSCSQSDQISSFGVTLSADLADGFITADGNRLVFNARADNLASVMPGLGALTLLKTMDDGAIEIISRANGPDGAIGFGSVGNPRISPDGRYVLFVSDANNLVPNDTNGVPDVFVRDLQLRTTVRISVSSSGLEGTASSIGGLPILSGAREARMSDDARYIIMITAHRRLVPQDTDNQLDCYLRDQWNQTTERLGNAPLSFPSPAQRCYSIAIAGDGSMLAMAHADIYLLPTPSNRSVFYRAPQASQFLRIERPDGTVFPFAMERPSLSLKASEIVFSTAQANIVPGDSDSPGQIYSYRFATNSFQLFGRLANGAISTLQHSNPQSSRIGGMVSYFAQPIGTPTNQGAQYLYIPDTPSANTLSGTYTQAFVNNQTQWQLDFIGPPGTALSCAFEAPSSAFSMPNSNTALPGQIVVNALAPGRVVLLCSSGNTLIARYELQASVAMQVPGLRGVGVMVLGLFVLGFGAAFAGRR